MTIKPKKSKGSDAINATGGDKNKAILVTMFIILLFVALVSISLLASVSSMGQYQPASMVYTYQKNDTPLQTSVTIVYSKGA